MNTAGRRVYPGPDGELPHMEPGDYGKDAQGRWFALPPDTDYGGGYGCYLNQPGHGWQVEEHHDGTISVTPSIHVSPPNGWHGFLEYGVWRKV